MRTREHPTQPRRDAAPAAHVTRGLHASHRTSVFYETMSATVAKSRKAAASKGTDATAVTTKRTTRAAAASTGYTSDDVAKHDKVRRGRARVGGSWGNGGRRE